MWRSGRGETGDRGQPPDGPLVRCTPYRGTKDEERRTKNEARRTKKLTRFPVRVPTCSVSAPQRVVTVTALRPSKVQQQRLSVISNALSRAEKEAQVAKLVPLLEESSVVLGVRYQGLTVKQMMQFRRALPTEGATLMVCKNTLLKNAADQVGGWEDLKPAAKGDNAWLFIQEEQIADSIKAYLAFQKETKEELPKEERDSLYALTMTGGAMSGEVLTEADLKRLEKMPTKKELIATIARLLNQLPTKVAVGVKQVPTKLAFGVKALADADDNKGAVVGDVLPKAE